MGTVSNFRLEPVSVKMQSQETTQVDCVADVSSALDGKYFKLYTGAGTGYYAWLDIASAADPAPAGFTAIPVVVASNASAATIAAAMVTAINAVSGFHAKAHPTTSGSFIILNELYGATTATVDGAAATGFTFTQLRAGSDYDLGYTDGNIELTFDDQLVDVMAHQEGSTVLTGIRSGKNIDELAVTLKECSVANIKEILKKSATLTTPTGGSSTAAWGDSALQFTQVLGLCEKLVLHPVALSSSDRSRDVALWSAYLKPGTITFSGEEPWAAACTFKFFPDKTKEKSSEFLVYGDHLQNWLRS